MKNEIKIDVEFHELPLCEQQSILEMLVDEENDRFINPRIRKHHPACIRDKEGVPYVEGEFGKWIKFTDGMPEDPCDYLFTDGRIVYSALFENGIYFSDGDESENEGVIDGLTHWMKYPDPPAEAEQWPKYWTKLDPADSKVAYVKQVSKSSGIIVYRTGHESDEFPWYEIDDNLRKALTEAEAYALLQKPEQCVACDAPAEPGTAGCRDCNEYATAICSPEPQPAKKRVRLWLEGPTKMIMCRDKAPYGDWQEIHHDAEGFYVVE